MIRYYWAIPAQKQELKRYPHNGAMDVNGGRELVRTYGGRLQHIVPKKCEQCKSLYHYMTTTPARVRKLCPACLPSYNKNRATAWARANWDRKLENARVWRFKKYRTDREFRERHRTYNREYYRNVHGLKPTFDCIVCTKPIPRGIGKRGRICKKCHPMYRKFIARLRWSVGL